MIIPLQLENESYDIVLERGALKQAGALLDLNRNVLVVTDDGVPASYAKTVADQCRSAKIVTIPQGEASKNFTEFRHLLSEMLNASFTRSDCVVAVGGGVVGDLSGFAAACYMRGIDFYNIPTTLLSEVDSSIGGKTAIDLDGVKNIVGAFYQPKKVLIDPDTLKTLDPRQFAAGMAEAVKMAFTCDKSLFERIKNSSNLTEDLETIIAGALQIKKEVVEQDPKEAGLRKVLNFGHTIGHGIESFYEGAMLHGECVALGMLPMCSDRARKELMPVLEQLHLPVRLEASAEEILPFVLHDKKRGAEGISTVFVEEPGSFVFQTLSPEEIANRLQSFLKQ